MMASLRRNRSRKSVYYYSESEEESDQSEGKRDSREPRSRRKQQRPAVILDSLSSLSEDSADDGLRVPEVSEVTGHQRTVGHKNTSVLSSGNCPKCGRYYRGLKYHVLNNHQGQFTVNEASALGLKICRCGRLCKTLALHWVKSCPLPPTEQNQKLREDFVAAEPPRTSLENTIPRPPTSKIKHLFETLQNDCANDDDILRGYKTLAGLPGYSRYWRPAEIRLLNKATTRLCQTYVSLKRNVDLLRILCMIKVAATPMMTKNSVSRLSQRLEAYPYLEDEVIFEACLLNRRQDRRPRTQSIADRVHKRLSQGRIGMASKLLEATHGLAPLDTETLEKLKQLHPEEEEHRWQPPRDSTVKLTRAVVMESLAKTSIDTAGGPSGLDGQFIRAVRHNEAFVDFLLLTASKVAQGTQEVKELFLSARCIPLIKNSRRDVRPIAVTEIFYRLIAKMIARVAIVNLEDCQFGCGTPLGVEPLVHSCSLRAETHALISIDLKNAFNSVRRSFLHQCVEKRSKDLRGVLAWAYGQHSTLFLSEDLSLSSQSGVKQGDPLAPIFFSIAYAEILQEMKHRFENEGIVHALSIAAYLDDTYVIVRERTKEKALKIVEELFREREALTGFQLRPEKTWMTTPRNFRRNGAVLLGTHIGNGATEFLDERLSEWRAKVQKLSTLQAQDAFTILRRCYLPQLSHLLRTLDVSEQDWKEADDVVNSFVQQQVQRFSSNTVNSSIVTLPLRHGGLGLTNFSRIQQVALEASRNSSFEFLSRRFPTLIFPSFAENLGSQKERSKTVWKSLKEEVLQSLSPEEQRLFLDNASEIGSKFLHALPVEKLMKLSDGDFLAAVCSRLLQKQQVCRVCTPNEVQTGHQNYCKGTSSLRSSRHEMIKNALHRAFRDAGADVVVEPPSTANRKRADLCVFGEVTDGKVVLDVSVVSVAGTAAAQTVVASLPPSVHATNGNVVNEKLDEIQRVLDARDRRKKRQHAGQDYGGRLQTFLLTTGGSLHKPTIKFLDRLKHLVPRVHERLKYEVSVHLARCQARSFYSCFVPTARRRPLH